MNVPDDSSLLTLYSIVKQHNPDVLAMWLARTDDQFLEAAERAVERAIKLIEGGAKKYTVLDELGLSTMLANLLTQAGLPTEAEGYHNGHVDVRIHHFDRGRFQYLGECKLHDGFKHHCDGCAQVLGQYGFLHPDCPKGECVVA